MKNTILLLLLIISLSYKTYAQKLQIGSDYGRAYFFYQYRDDGAGFVNEYEPNYHFIAGLSLSKQFKRNLFWETGLRFSYYEQYYSTRKYQSAFEEGYPIIQIPVLIGYSTKAKLGFRGSAGLILGMMPDQFEGEFKAMHIYPQVDSITRGTINRSLTPFFPLLNVNAGMEYVLTDFLKAEIKASYGKGLVKITEYDIYYNDGSGKNDQHACQWGKGDFASLTLGIRYSLKGKR
jgi:hypothetical protein